MIKNQLPPSNKGLWGAYKEIIPAVFKQAKDSNYKIHQRRSTKNKYKKGVYGSNVFTQRGRKCLRTAQRCDTTLHEFPACPPSEWPRARWTALIRRLGIIPRAQRHDLGRLR